MGAQKYLGSSGGRNFQSHGPSSAFHRAEPKDRLKERPRIAVRHEPKKGLVPKKSCLKRSSRSLDSQLSTASSGSTNGCADGASPASLTTSFSSETDRFLPEHDSQESDADEFEFRRTSEFELRSIIRAKVREANRALMLEQPGGAVQPATATGDALPLVQDGVIGQKRRPELTAEELRWLDGLRTKKQAGGADVKQ